MAASRALPPGYSIRFNSTYRPGATVAGTGGVSQHSLGKAADVSIVGPDGVAIPNTGEDKTGLYGRLAEAAHKVNGEKYPELVGQLAWGGNFTTGPANGPKDLMHFDYGGDRGRFGRLATPADARMLVAGPAAPSPEVPMVPAATPSPAMSTERTIALPQTQSAIAEYLGTNPRPLVVPRAPFGISEEAYNKGVEQGRQALSFPVEQAARVAATGHTIVASEQGKAAIEHTKAETRRLGVSLPSEVTQEVDLTRFGMPMKVSLTGKEAANLAMHLGTLQMQKEHNREMEANYAQQREYSKAHQAALEAAQAEKSQKEASTDAFLKEFGDKPSTVKVDGKFIPWKSVPKGDVLDLIKEQQRAENNLRLQDEITNRQVQTQEAHAERQKSAQIATAYKALTSGQHLDVLTMKSKIKKERPGLTDVEAQKLAVDSLMVNEFGPGWRGYLQAEQGNTGSGVVGRYNPTTGRIE